MDDENMITEKQAARLVEWVQAHGHSQDEAYQALAFVMNAERKEDKKKEAPKPSRK